MVKKASESGDYGDTILSLKGAEYLERSSSNRITTTYRCFPEIGHLNGRMVATKAPVINQQDKLV